MTIKPIKTEEDFDQAIQEIKGLFGTPLGSEASDRLEALVKLAHAYEVRKDRDGAQPFVVVPQPRNLAVPGRPFASPQPGFARELLGGVSAEDLTLSSEEAEAAFEDHL